MPFDSSDEAISHAPPPRVVARYLFLAEALLAQSRLDSADIETFLIDETVARLDWYWLSTLGGVRIMVRGDEADDAALILAAPLLPQFETERGALLPQPTCPRCNSLDIAYRPATQSNILVSVLVNPIAWLLLLFARDRWRCFSCGYSWADQQYEGFPEPPAAAVTPIA
jgi:hypothetical protein